MSFEITTPESWLDLSLHPTFEGKRFDKAWYDGDLDADLLLLRRACSLIRQTTPEFGCELVVLDDCTFFAKLTYDGDDCCELYPSVTSDNRRCLFFAFLSLPDLELRVLTEKEAVEIMQAFGRKEDLTVFDRIE